MTILMAPLTLEGKTSNNPELESIPLHLLSRETKNRGNQKLKANSPELAKSGNPSKGHGDSYIPGMETVIATTSGYNGREKTELIELIIETGATYTGSLTKSNTHVV
ncbi:hypothetical protein SUGI_0636960 [Cryptomeria japonica]|nr:hypothetical protein SUGI_0636960 [Cryptomeria japonica]